ncbi:hypothetical protein QBC40DRAFT_257972 [Triangularia verruculosa]|uniref:Uncharacterized protein n=1 Tax=Triangularia verruculosa TaxID=2587418 RepID=A0AAN7AS48_9PEZI|nr:hypothetical protein QBC40DRAFT_257972 [Triangularia verruculosa]
MARHRLSLNLVGGTIDIKAPSAKALADLDVTDSVAFDMFVERKVEKSVKETTAETEIYCSADLGMRSLWMERKHAPEVSCA